VTDITPARLASLSGMTTLATPASGTVTGKLNLGGKTKIIQDYGLNSGISDLILNTHITIGEVAAILGETSTVGDQEDVDDFDASRHSTTQQQIQYNLNFM